LVKKKNKKEKKEKKNTQIKSDSFLKAVFYTVAIFLVIRFFCSFMTDQRLWGLNHAGYIDGMFLIYPVFLLICYGLYSLGSKKAALWSGGAEVPEGLSKSIYPYLILVVFGLAFYFLRTAAHFLGDGYQLLSHLADPMLILKPESYGDMKIHQIVAGWIDNPEPRMSVYISFRYIALFSGLVYAATLLYYGRRVASTKFGYYTFVIVGLLTASAVLFFGYVETYALVTAFAYLFFVSALAAVKNGKSSIVPIIAFILAIFFHRIAILLLPALLVYLFIVFAGEKLTGRVAAKRKNILILLGALIVVFYIVVMVAAPLDIKRIFLSPFGDRFTTDGYSLLSIKHIADYINLLLFLTPLFLIVTALGRKWMIKSDDSGVNASILFVLVGAVTGLLAAFLIEPKLGMARDWDLFSTMLIPAHIAGVYLWILHFERQRRFQPATIMIALLSLSIFVPWLALNKTRKGFYLYAIQVMQQDPKHGRSGVYTMIPMHERQGNRMEVERLRRFCAVNYPEMEMVRQTERYLLEGDLMRADRLADRAMGENPSFFRSFQLKARILMALGKNDESLEYFEIADALNPYNSNNSYYRGRLHAQKGEQDKAVALYRQSIKYDALNPFPFIEMANHFNNSGMGDSARYYFRLIPDTVEVYPYDLYYKFGLSGLEIGDTTRALLFFDRYLEVGDDSALVGKIETFKRSLDY